MKKKQPFNFYKNVFALSFTDRVKNQELKCDFMLEGNPDKIANALIEQMERHPQVAELITMTAYNYLERTNHASNLKN